VFADNMRFVWDDDVRFNGFQEVLKLPVGKPGARIDRIELRAGEYILTNPNIAILSPTSPFASAGFTVGRSVRAANLFHPGIVVAGGLGGAWRHQMSVDLPVYCNPNQIQLASTAAGFPVLVNNCLPL